MESLTLTEHPGEKGGEIPNKGDLLQRSFINIWWLSKISDRTEVFPFLCGELWGQDQDLILDLATGQTNPTQAGLFHDPNKCPFIAI